jgi:formate hydrogenlyase transcriptional activator
MNRRIERIPSSVMDALVRYAWPGNIRELQNFIERAVILSEGRSLQPPLAELRESKTRAASAGATLKEVERKHILQVLRETEGVLGGPQGAAARLGIPRTTLIYRMRRLGIDRPAD